MKTVSSPTLRGNAKRSRSRSAPTPKLVASNDDGDPFVLIAEFPPGTPADWAEVSYEQVQAAVTALLRGLVEYGWLTGDIPVFFVRPEARGAATFGAFDGSDRVGTVGEMLTLYAFADGE